jgi:hypothetical protein
VTFLGGEKPAGEYRSCSTLSEDTRYQQATLLFTILADIATYREG